MIKLGEREMKNLSRILSVMLCFAPLVTANAAGPVATTAGSNLTAYNPSNAMNNQWANLSNGRYDSANAPSAKADFGNCNALILRCAQPKCANGGCSEASVAAAIVKGCVQSNKTCAQYGDDLVEYMSAQLVASSNAKINEQQMAAQQAAAAAAQQQSEQQMQQMQYQMQQMQEQMAQQQAESAQQLQAALAQQAAQNQAALESMKTAATESAKETESGVTAYQQEAINRGISEDVLARQTITGQIMTEIENAEVSLKAVETAMRNSFEYAGCDARGNNCSGPKRVKKWRELATEFLTPYDNAIDNIYDALVIAQTVGVDLSQIYMMLNNSCNRWGQYLCPQMTGGTIRYPSTDKGQKGIPQVCPGNSRIDACRDDCDRRYNLLKNKQTEEKDGKKVTTEAYEMTNSSDWNTCYNNCASESGCQPCTLVKVLTESTEDKDAVYAGWVDADYSTDNGNTSVVACASSALDSSTLFTRRTKNKNGAGLVDIDKLDTWLHQVEPSKKYSGGTEPMQYCDANYPDFKELLERSVFSKTVPTKGAALCVAKPGFSNATNEDKGECGYISPIYAICDTHPYNAGKSNASQTTSNAGDNTEDDTAKAIAKCKEKQNCGSCDGKSDNKTCCCDKILWAEKAGNSDYEVKFCAENYQPDKDNYCKYNKEYSSKGGEKTQYESKQKEYTDYIATRYGETREIVALKVTAISQQMYKQYEYLNATLRRLKTQLEKAALTATLEAAGAKDDNGSSSSGGLLGGNSAKNSQYADCSGKDIQSTLYCLRQNYTALGSQINNKKCDKKAKEQLKTDINLMNSLLKDGNKVNECNAASVADCKTCLGYYNAGLIKLDDENLDREAKRQGRYRD